MDIMWKELLTGLCLAFVIEGILPFVNPQAARQAFATMAQMDDRTVRILGFASMIFGAVVLYLVR